MDSFSWTDGLRATVSTCLPCFSSRNSSSDTEAENEGHGRLSRGTQLRYEELEGLLGELDDTNGDAETMSLHSNIGDSQRRPRSKKKKTRGRAKKSIRFFGYDLFGRPPIQLPDSEDEEDTPDNDMGSAGSRRRDRTRPNRLSIGNLPSAHSSSSASATGFDSDASPLDTTAISKLSPQDAARRAAQAAALLEAEEQRRRVEREERDERRKRRKERKELKRIGQAIANGSVNVSLDGEEFEGFPGSGSLRPPSSFSPGAGSGFALSSLASPPVVGPNAPGDDFGPYVGGLTRALTRDFADGDEDGEADFGGEAYTRKASSRGSRGSDSSRSHSHSQTSASRSNAGSSSHYQYNHHYLSQAQSSPLPSPQGFLPGTGMGSSIFTPAPGSGFRSATGSMGPGANLGALFDSSQQRKKTKKTRSSKSDTTASTMSASKKSSLSPTSQSASLPSLEDSPSSHATSVPSEPFIVDHNGGNKMSNWGTKPDLSFDTNSNTNANESKFPSADLFGGMKRTNSIGSGVFLARRGDD